MIFSKPCTQLVRERALVKKQIKNKPNSDLPFGLLVYEKEAVLAPSDDMLFIGIR